MYMQDQYMPTSYMPQNQDYGMSYAKGGQVPYSLSALAEMMQGLGSGKDEILAHINSSEAQELAGENGYDINPFTGLPQFGLWDRIRSALPGPGGIANMMGAAGNAAMGALPGLYEQARPYMSQGLQKADQSIMGALPGIGQKIGGMFGQQGAALGQSFGNQIGQQFGNAGGLSNYVMGQADQKMGVGAPNPQQPYNFGNMAQQVGKGVWGDVGREEWQGQALTMALIKELCKAFKEWLEIIQILLLEELEVLLEALLLTCMEIHPEWLDMQCREWIKRCKEWEGK